MSIKFYIASISSRKGMSREEHAPQGSSPPPYHTYSSPPLPAPTPPYQLRSRSLKIGLTITNLLTSSLTPSFPCVHSSSVHSRPEERRRVLIERRERSVEVEREEVMIGVRAAVTAVGVGGDMAGGDGADTRSWQRWSATEGDGRRKRSRRRSSPTWSICSGIISRTVMASGIADASQDESQVSLVSFIQVKGNRELNLDSTADGRFGKKVGRAGGGEGRGREGDDRL